MTRLYTVFLASLVFAQTSVANVEKVIFLGPTALKIPTQSPNLDDLQLAVLSPQQSALRTQLCAEFPKKISPNGDVSWILLENLSEGQRYEVRICWAATQPTSFRIKTYIVSEVFSSADLISSLATYSETRQAQVDSFEDQPPSISRRFRESEYGLEELESVLLLQIFAAADYYTTNRTLMEHVPAVLVDIILDPYLLNIFPKSLVPTAFYLIAIAIASWYLAKFIAKWLRMVASIDDSKKYV